MRRNKRNGNGASRAPGFVALFGMLALGLGSTLAALPAAAQPFAYVTNLEDGTVSVIDTATNTVLTGKGFPIFVKSLPIGVAITSGWETRLRRKSDLQQCFGDRYGY